MNARALLFLILGIDALILFLELSDLSIGYHEAHILYADNSLLSWIVQGSLALFGTSDLALRSPMVAMHLLSAILLYAIAKPYVRYDRDRLWLVLIYVLLPGVSSAALLVDSAGLVILTLFLFIYLHRHYHAVSMVLLGLTLLVDASFWLLYLGLFLHAVVQRRRGMSVYTLGLFAAAMYLYGFDTGGLPKGHLLDTFGIYAAIFSPIVFVYLVYVLYRRFVLKEVDILWFIASTALAGSLLLSLRQALELQMFAPYLMAGLPLAAQTFFHSYRVRLKRFRRNYRIVFTVSFALLVLNALVVFFNKELYRVLDDPTSHFGYRFHVVKPLAQALQTNSIGCVNAADAKLQLRLRFYGVGECETFRLSAEATRASKVVTISYKEALLYRVYVTNIHKTAD